MKKIFSYCLITFVYLSSYSQIDTKTVISKVYDTYSEEVNVINRRKDNYKFNPKLLNKFINDEVGKFFISSGEVVKQNGYFTIDNDNQSIHIGANYSLTNFSPIKNTTSYFQEV